MKKSRQFRPVVSDTRLEERVVMSTVPAQIFVGQAARPVATGSQVTATLNQLHNDLLLYQRNVTNAILFTQAQITAGRVTQPTAVRLLESYIGNKTSLLFYQTRGAASNLPYGAGFNGYINSAGTQIADLPSGSESLYSLLTFPLNGTAGPIATLQDNVFTSVSTGNFNGALQAVNSAAIHSTYNQVRAIVNSYVVNGFHNHDFGYHS